MNIVRFATIGALGTVAALAAVPERAHACQGTVYGLSRTYDLKRGSGFLAIRARPSSRARMVGQTFNGNTVDIRRRSGRWLFVFDYGSGKRGWVHGRWVDTYC